MILIFTTILFVSIPDNVVFHFRNLIKKRLITKILKTNRAKLSDKMQQNMLTAKRQEVEQLRIESRVERKKVSRCLQELMDFCEANKKDDGLLVGLNNAKDNPWR